MNLFKLRTKTVMLATLVAIAGGMGINAASAAAAPPTLPPIIVEKPSDPSTTGPAVFEIGPDPADAGDVNEIRCTVPSADPGGVQTNCWTPEDGETAIWVAQGVANGPATFTAYATDGSGGNGPTATYSWTQNIPAPTAAPVITETPDPINTEMPAKFAFEPGAADTSGVAGFQCRLDSDDPADFYACNRAAPLYGQGVFDFGTKEYWQIGNGTHTMDVRAKTGTNVGPIASHTWTNDVPSDINPSVSISDAAITKWSGGPGNTLGNQTDNNAALQNTGDMNGDGRDDLVAGSYAFMNEAVVLYSPEQGLGDRSITAIPPNLGYSMRSADSVYQYDVLEDLNGDDVSDFVVLYGSAGIAAVVYGVADATQLPKCAPGPAQMRCVDLDNLTNEQGYYINAGPGTDTRGAGDFDGDGAGDIQIGTAGLGVQVIKGMARTGTIDPTTLPANETFTIQGTNFFGYVPQSLGDLNGDGKDDIYNGDLLTGYGWVFNGRAFGSPSLNVDTSFTPADGLKIAQSPIALYEITNVGDVNGDGRPDLAFASALTNTVLFLPQQPTDDFILPEDPLDNGYAFDDPGTQGVVSVLESNFGAAFDNVGDFNNDGVPDQLIGAPDTTHGADTTTGAGYIMFGQRPRPADGMLGVGSDLTAAAGVAILGEDPGDFGGLGRSATALGDITGDGVIDFALGDDRVDGKVYIVSGGKIVANAKMGAVTGITKETATLNAAVVTTGRDTQVKFEYGTTAQYGSETAVQNVEGSGNATPVEADLTGLAATTTYHYRAVLTNSLGLTYYGEDQTFTTNNTSGGGGDACATNPAAPGCSGYCAANPGAAGCQAPRAKLGALVVSPKTIKVKRGKRGTITANITNAGNKAASGAKVCVKAPKKLVKVKKCQKIGSLGAGKTAVKTFKVTVKRKAKKGKRISLNFTASGSGLDNRKAKAKIAVR